MKQSNDKNEEAENKNWLQVLAFGSVIDSAHKKIEAMKPSTVFEVMP